MIVLFDGTCNLCNRAVDFIIRRDPRLRIRFAAQQSAAGQRILREHRLEHLAPQTMLVIEDDRVHTRSTAALRIARALRAPWPLCYALIVMPRGLRDPLYDWIARHRHRLFGRRETCRVPTTSERERFVE